VLNATVGGLQASSGGFGAGRGGGDQDRNVFDPRDYKIADLGSKPTVVRWKKWRRGLENFVDTIGTSWKGTSGLLRQLRYRDQPFQIGQLDAALADAEKRHDKLPEKSFYNFEEKADTLYRLIMPKLDELLSNEFAQTGTENGFELYRQLSRKIDPPRADLAFDLKAEIEGLGKHSCANFGQTFRFLEMLDRRVRDFTLETGEEFSKDSLASILRRSVDPDTADRMDESDVPANSFQAVDTFIRKRESRLRSRGTAPSGKGPDAMVYGILSPEAPVPTLSSAATALEAPLVDPWAGAAANPWLRAALPVQPVQPTQ
jgi:hypothetical protein